jgi:polysaccharide export outer membrane protein
MNKYLIALLAVGFLGAMTGCETPPQPTSTLEEQHAEITLREGDTIKVTFPGAPNLDTAPQPIRRDGKITLGLVGEVSAVGLTPTELQTQILAKVGDQLVTKEVMVTVVASDFSVYVDGPVMKPGKITTDHPMTIMEAIMEAGGFQSATADMRHVTVMRHKGQSKSYTYLTLDLKSVLDGKQKDLFYLEPGDIVHVPQKFSWF